MDQHTRGFIDALRRIDAKDKNRNRKNYCWNEEDAQDIPGARTCGNPSCVRPGHLIPDYEMEWLDISYRTGNKLTYQEIYKQVVGERW
jgi:hypothetical protein